VESKGSDTEKDMNNPSENAKAADNFFDRESAGTMAAWPVRGAGGSRSQAKKAFAMKYVLRGKDAEDMIVHSKQTLETKRGPRKDRS